MGAKMIKELTDKLKEAMLDCVNYGAATDYERDSYAYVEDRIRDTLQPDLEAALREAWEAGAASWECDAPDCGGAKIIFNSATEYIEGLKNGK